MPENLLRLPAVLQRTGLKRSKLYNLISRGEFVRPVKIHSCAAWPESEVSAWIAARMAEREAA